MRAALILALWPSLVSAEDVARYVWGNPVDGSTPSELALEPCHTPCVAVVRFDNTLVGHGRTNALETPAPVRATLAIPGVAITVIVETGTGLTPDLMQVLPPPGYVAEPYEIQVNDDTSGRVRVVLQATS